MALLGTSPSTATRVSQQLPPIKCSLCSKHVPFDQLSDHICHPPSSPALSPPTTPTTGSLPSRLQGLLVTPRTGHQHLASPSPTRSTFQDQNPHRQPLPNHNAGLPPPGRPDQQQRSRSPLLAQPSNMNRPPAAYHDPSPRSTPQAPRPVEQREPVRAPPPAAQANIDTKSGGTAGMAGVGRRGFEAVARAALFTVGPGHGSGGNMPPHAGSVDPASGGGRVGPGWGGGPPTGGGMPPPHVPVGQRGPPGMQPPHTGGMSSYLRVNTAATPGTGMPMKSPPSPHMPGYNANRAGGMQSPRPDADLRVPRLDIQGDTTRGYSSQPSSPFPRSPDAFISTSLPPSPLPNAQRGVFEQQQQQPRPKLPEQQLKPNHSLTVQTDIRANPQPQGRPSPSPTTPHTRSPIPFTAQHDSPPESPMSDSGYGGLAYADSEEEREKDDVVLKKPAKPSSPIVGSPTLKSILTVRTPNTPGAKNPRKDPVTSPISPDGARMRSGSESSASASNYSHTTAHDNILRARFDDDHRDRDGRKNYAGKIPTSPDQTRSPKQPMRSRTTTSISSPIVAASPLRAAKTVRAGGGKEWEAEAKKVKVCVRCEKKIDDGRWVKADGGKTLCAGCWKNMYLPKCRRCNLPIEKHAISSTDGQLKGKYHKECFNCHRCNKPFPDRSFYVFDGKPLCAYHYHEANDSLCAAATCGQPIEGPCAVSHAGDRYHPEHILCEHPGFPKCKQRLDDYWEVDGRMLCERHANAAMRADGAGIEEEPQGDQEQDRSRKRAMKRTTRFIDLAGGGALM